VLACLTGSIVGSHTGTGVRIPPVPFFFFISLLDPRFGLFSNIKPLTVWFRFILRLFLLPFTGLSSASPDWQCHLVSMRHGLIITFTFLYWGDHAAVLFCWWAKILQWVLQLIPFCSVALCECKSVRFCWISMLPLLTLVVPYYLVSLICIQGWLLAFEVIYVILLMLVFSVVASEHNKRWVWAEDHIRIDNVLVRMKLCISLFCLMKTRNTLCGNKIVTFNPI